MTDAEIIKSLECCKMPVGSGACNGCSLKDIRNKRLIGNEKSCTTVLLENALDLINRQKAEIERLKEPVSLVVNCDVPEDILKTLRNQKVINLSNDEAEAICIWDKHVRAEAIKEFAERLKEHSRKMQSSDFSGEFWDRAMIVTDIDNLVKEMAGDAE